MRFKILTLALLLAACPTVALAAYNTITFNSDTSLYLSGSAVTLTVASGSIIESLVVNSTSIDVGISPGSFFAVTEATGYKLNNSLSATTCNGTSDAPPSNTGFQDVTVGQTITITPDTSTVWCTGTSHSTGGTTPSGGGGGGGTTVTTPTNTSIKINSGAATTTAKTVTLTLAAENATLMMVSNNSSFSDITTWENYATAKTWTLTSGDGTKTVYVKYRSASGGDSSTLSDSIELTQDNSGATPTPTDTTAGVSGDVVKKANSQALYYLGSDSKLHNFPSLQVYQTWYSSFAGVKTLSDTEFNSYAFGENVFPKAGVKLVQAVDGDTPWHVANPKVYALTGDGILRQIMSADVAVALYGANWESKIIPVPVSTFSQYKSTGADINVAADYNVANETAAYANVNAVKD